jgi:hypothetical protein
MAGEQGPGTFWGDHSFVVRTNTIEIFRRDMFKDHVKLAVSLQNVGTTSWRSTATLRERDTGVVLARCAASCAVLIAPAPMLDPLYTILPLAALSRRNNR